MATRAGDAQWLEPTTHCPRCRRDFFPQSKRLGIDQGHHSPAVLQRVIYAGTHHPSFDQAGPTLRHLADLHIPTKQVERLTRGIGLERCAERDAAVEAYRARPLVERKAVAPGVAAPAVAVVQMDGGRLQIFDRTAPAPAEAAAGHWREDQIGLLAAMASAPSAVDPCPVILVGFVEPLRLTREIKGAAGVTEDAVSVAEEPAAVEPVYVAPALAGRTVVATHRDAEAFGGMLARAARARGFYGATRRAFVADGSATRGVWERHFSNFEPIVDFIHALTYVFGAALAGRPFADGWAAYTEWIQQVWAGQVASVLPALAARQAALGEPTEADADTSPRWLVAWALEYLRNQQGRMKYAAYRTQGLPITSSHIESTIKQVNQRVKGSEKFWSATGAEAILQLRADVLSETEPLTDFWIRRQARATGQRRYSRAA